MGHCNPKFEYLKLIEAYLENPFFEELRSVKQLGYSTYSYLIVINRVYGINLVIQSNRATTIELSHHIDIFIHRIS